MELKILKTKKKSPKWYSILIIPQGYAGVRRWKVPAWSLYAGAILSFVCLFVTVTICVAAVHYRHGWLATASVRGQNEELKAEKVQLDEKFASLVDLAKRTEFLATRLENVLGINKKVMYKGIGPIAEEEILPFADIPSLGKYELKSDNGEYPSAAFNDLELKMDKLGDSIASVEMRLQDVYGFHKAKLAYWASIPSVSPVKGWITSKFGLRRRPGGIGTRFHSGVDIAASIGTPIYAPGSGIVTFAGYKPGTGKTVIIDHGFGVTTIYGHAYKIYAKAGETVGRGTKIAAVGNSGLTTGPHLHYQVEVDGVPVDPMHYVIEGI